MITSLKIINQPNSGEFKERIYDPFEVGTTQKWSWIKFHESDGYQWCGQFRGYPKGAEISKIDGRTAILTQSAFYLIENQNGELINCILNDDNFNSLTISPKNDFIVSNDFEIYKFDLENAEFDLIDSTAQFDLIKFKDWKDQYLIGIIH